MKQKRSAKKKLKHKRILVFFLSYVIFIFIAAFIFPVDETNTALVPDWYYVGTGLVSILIAVFYDKFRFLHYKEYTLSIFDNKSAIKPRYKTGSDKDIAKGIVIETGQASVSMIQRKTGWKYERAARAMDQLEACGIVGPFDGKNPRKILASTQSGHISSYSGSQDELAFIDQMEGHDFEQFVANLLRKLGYERVEVTPESGDQGVDIIARKGEKRYAIQCKRYSKKLGNKPVQEVYAGKTIYGCNIAAVITNNYFTAGAREAALSTGVLLWDRDELRQMIRFANWKDL